MTVSPTTKAKRPAAAKILRRFREFLEIKDTGVTLAERQTDLRDELLDTVTRHGEEDDKGNIWLALSEPIEFADHTGKVKVYTDLKAEKHVSPAKPTVDPELAEELLRKKKLFLTTAQEKVIQDLRVALPFVRISVEVDSDAVDAAYFRDVISEDEYTSILREQKVSFQFRPAES